MLVPNRRAGSESRKRVRSMRNAQDLTRLVYGPVQSSRMGKVVKLDAAAKERGKAAPATKQRKTGRRRRSKTALVLGGGGFTGGVYEIGALRAPHPLSGNRTRHPFRRLHRPS